jgi:6-phosphofructokinase 1
MVFLSYHHPDRPFVEAVHECLAKHPHVLPFFYPRNQQASHWASRVQKALLECKTFVLFLPEQQQPAGTWLDEWRNAVDREIPRLIIRKDTVKVPVTVFIGDNCGEEIVERFDPQSAPWVAERIIHILRLDNPFDVPIGYPFDYEKKIIEAYAVGNGEVGPDKVGQGCPAKWPDVERIGKFVKVNPVGADILGDYRKESAAIVVDTRVGWQEPDQSQQQTETLTFPEAGPRERLNYPVGDHLTVGILVSGGIAPGINAVIESIVNRHTLYRDKHKKKEGTDYALRIRGYLEGFQGFVRRTDNWMPLDSDRVKGLAGQAGAILRTSRAEELLSEDVGQRYDHFMEVITQLWGANVQILYVIGGEGSMKAAHAIWKIARDRNRPISVIGIPKTMDNDILWVWQSFGFLSAVEEARKAILNLHTEARSNPRLSIIQLFGSDSGFVVSHAALASGVCDAALIPEVRFRIKRCPIEKCPGLGLSHYIRGRLQQRLIDQDSPSALIVMAETAIPEDALDYVDDPEIRLFKEEKDAVREFLQRKGRNPGQTPDELRSAGVKIVSRALFNDIRAMKDTNPYWEKYRVFTNEPRHLLRSIAPSVSDVVFGERLGALAVDNAMAGYTDFMVSQWLTEYVLVPLKLVILGRKRVREDGMFWKSVLASTGQDSHKRALHEKEEQEQGAKTPES